MFAHFGSLGGSTSGPDLATLDYWTTGPQYTIYAAVDGDDTYTGSRDRPLRTLAAAVALAATNASSTIGLLPGFTETITASVALSKAGVKIWGLGQGSQKARLTGDLATNAVLNISGAGCWLANVYFPASETADAVHRVVTSGAGVRITDCDFISGALEKTDKYALNLGGTYNVVTGCTFTATARAQYGAVTIGGDHCYLDDCDFDGGSAGWFIDYGIYIAAVNGTTIGAGCTLRNNSNIVIANGSQATLLGPDVGEGCLVGAL